MPPVADDGPADTSLVADASLVRRLRLGQEDAATQLYLRYAPRVRMLAKLRCSPDLAPRFDADDIVQSVFRSFFRGVSEGLYDAPEGEELWRLLVVIALNKIRTAGTYHRAAKRDVRMTVPSDQEEASSQADADHQFLTLTVQEVLDGLPDLQRQIALLRLEGYEVAEIARKMVRSKRTVERQLQLVRRNLKRYLPEAIPSC